MKGRISTGRKYRIVWETDDRVLAIERARDFDGNVASKHEDVEVVDTDTNEVIWIGWQKEQANEDDR